MSYSIVIDGPAGAGKSTIAKEIAKRMNLIYVDTGAMYRAMALFLIREGITSEDTIGIHNKCQEADITIQHENGEQVVYLNGENVNRHLRTEEVGNMASVSSAEPAVREKLVELQRKLAKSSEVIMDGRDIGTCVLPDADVKIYLTAGTRVRAKRRYEELLAKGEDCDLDQIEQDIKERDYRDMTRDISPLRQAEDAIMVDSSKMSVEDVIQEIIKICSDKKSKNI